MSNWITKDKRVIPIEQLGDNHLRAILQMMQKKANQKLKIAKSHYDSAIVEVLEHTWRDYTPDLFPLLEQEAKKRNLEWEILFDDKIDYQRSRLEREIVGAIRMAIDAHGPINNVNAPSVAKRVIGVIKAHNKKYNESISGL